ncbi:MAG: phosphoenolpyruvate--protein phosphotransferase [Oscillospiraceae bacterium]|jgi:phosphotransferase system enzyme I (PtsI)|nr:phosphoenolpyruvate--protein phosphotransferase [Oscillospiraceae bacterium]
MRKFQGIGVSAGIGIGRVYALNDRRGAGEGRDTAGTYDPATESKRLYKAVNILSNYLGEMAKSAGDERAEILEGYMLLAKDSVILDEVKDMLATECCSCETAVEAVYERYAEILRLSDDEIISGRADDLRDVKNNYLSVLGGKKLFDAGTLPDGCILMGWELSASLVAGLNQSKCKGLISAFGGATSHMTIIARSLGIPAVVGVDIRSLEDGVQVIINGDIGDVIAEPAGDMLSEHSTLLENLKKERENFEQYRGLVSATSDGRVVELLANIGFETDIARAAASDAEGVGLFRTEFLFVNRDVIPSEEEQFLIYAKAAKAFPGKQVIIRTLDAGGDKDIPILGIYKEDNPYLGWRAIRYCLDREDLFRSQLRAIVRASAFGKVKIMLPMVSEMSELIRAKDLVENVKAQLAQQGERFDRDIPVGMMVETPAAALLADAFAREAAFFSIGTNDLTQYTLAVDRGNKKVARLYSGSSPAVLRLVYDTICAAKRHNIPCGLCGETGADPALAKFYIACGINELSMTSTEILRVRRTVREMNYTSAKALVEKAMPSLCSAGDVAALLAAL